ncbi:MAG: hypothetical protein KC619_16170 [Myxococcales bacterium]|nr:hypothetical protein [Myxococcales bacterium]
MARGEEDAASPRRVLSPARVAPTGGVLSSFLLSTLALGCYARHVPTPPLAADAGRVERDAGTDAGGVDAEVPLPWERTEDPGPDARPSDDPSARDWSHPPELEPDEPCCEPVGAPVDVPFSPAPWGIPAIAWNGAGWGLLYPRETTAFQALDPTGALEGPLRFYRDRPPSETGEDLGFDWAAGRYFTILLESVDDTPRTVVGLLDRRGVIATPFTDLGPVRAAGFVDHRSRWMAVRREPDGFGSRRVAVMELDLVLRPIGEAVAFEGDGSPLGVVGLKSRAVAFVLTAGNTIRAWELTPPIEASLGPGVAFPELAPVSDYTGLRVTRLRNRAVVVQAPSAAGPGSIATYDPFEHDARLHAYPVEGTSPFGRESARGAAGMDEIGVIATCTVFHREDGSGGVLLRVLGAEGEAIGAPVIVEERPAASDACAVGATGDAIMFAWPRAASGAVRVQRFRLRR